MTRLRPRTALAALPLIVAACGGGSPGEPAAGSRESGQQAGAGLAEEGFALRVLSSPAQYVSGGDARIELRAPRALHEQLELWVNGAKARLQLDSDGDRLEGVVTGLAKGNNRLVLKQAGRRVVLASLTLTNYPITGPMFSGPQQQPFVCTTHQVGRQPLVDAASPPGFPVLNAKGDKIGYSKDCSIETFTTYWYRSTGELWRRLPLNGSRPADISTITLADGRQVDFVVRQERGTINRFLYSFAMLAPLGENPARPDTRLWNGRLVYYFQGGVGVGHTQGSMPNGAMAPELLSQGHAIVVSSGNNTRTQYNLQVAAETAIMTRERFIERYGLPLYTVGYGGSGGAVQQYFLAQNHPGILDAVLPSQSYPDIVTQMLYVGDCELLEHYMDVTDRDNPRWSQAKARSLLIGLNGEPGPTDRMSAIKPRIGLAGASMSTGFTECSRSWRGRQAWFMNPRYGGATNDELMEPPGLMDTVQWTHYDNLRNIYGVDKEGQPRTTWDNVGVQYGLESLKRGAITPQEFLDLNWKVGGWKQPKEMVQEGYPLLPGITGAMAVENPALFDPWSRRNMNLGWTNYRPAPRTVGNLNAMRAAYTSGTVFTGHMPLPAIDHRFYLERELDMHNVRQSFVVRQRVRQALGSAEHLVIWFTDSRPGVARPDQSLRALAVMEEWLANIRANPDKSVAQNRPARAVDSCFDAQGRLLHAGPEVWNGILDDKPAGACTRAFPMFGTSRTVAGAPFDGSVFRCALKSVDQALADGTYAPWQPDAAAVARLKRMFPQGVCDYGKGDRARP
ncbi:DUF6351 family protein [Azohydromonas caseinilytica]|uniref:DUF6351 domain-containing protein n=1 Tax=Azohydromonas caseinilytica TaxID=2728836 RepID=A0A848FDS7_9BURK|nr:DUF6351 family protein [Azohydromonas caseinilytica]NML17166.1 hypothetical protein [Azohydromonas caseinilytica]